MLCRSSDRACWMFTIQQIICEGQHAARHQVLEKPYNCRRGQCRGAGDQRGSKLQASISYKSTHSCCHRQDCSCSAEACKRRTWTYAGHRRPMMHQKQSRPPSGVQLQHRPACPHIRVCTPLCSCGTVLGGWAPRCGRLAAFDQAARCTEAASLACVMWGMPGAPSS